MVGGSKATTTTAFYLWLAEARRRLGEAQRLAQLPSTYGWRKPALRVTEFLHVHRARRLTSKSFTTTYNNTRPTPTNYYHYLSCKHTVTAQTPTTRPLPLLLTTTTSTGPPTLRTPRAPNPSAPGTWFEKRGRRSPHNGCNNNGGWAELCCRARCRGCASKGWTKHCCRGCGGEGKAWVYKVYTCSSFCLE